MISWSRRAALRCANSPRFASQDHVHLRRLEYQIESQKLPMNSLRCTSQISAPLQFLRCESPSPVERQPFHTLNFNHDRAVSDMARQLLLKPRTPVLGNPAVSCLHILPRNGKLTVCSCHSLSNSGLRLHSNNIPQTYRAWAVPLVGWGAGVGILAGLFLSNTPIFKNDVLTKLPIVCDSLCTNWFMCIGNLKLTICDHRNRLDRIGKTRRHRRTSGTRSTVLECGACLLCTSSNQPQ